MLRLFYFLLISFFACFPDFANAQAKPKRDVSKDRGSNTTTYRTHVKRTNSCGHKRASRTLLKVNVDTGNKEKTQPEAYVVKSKDESTLTFYYDVCKDSRNGTLYELNIGDNYPGWVDTDKGEVSGNSKCTTVIFDKSFKNARPVSCARWFVKFENLKRIEGVENLNTSNVTSMRAMFSCCEKLTSIDVSHFNTSSVTTMQAMFYNCKEIKYLDLSRFNTSNVTNMLVMFLGCEKLSRLVLDGFDTANVTTMGGMFYGCTSLISLDLSCFNTSKVTTMSGMFRDCEKLKCLDINSFDTSEVTTMSGMFKGCVNLESLDLNNFNTSNVANMSWMFYKCTNLETLDISSFNTSKVTYCFGMLFNCSKLKTIFVNKYSCNIKTSVNRSDILFNCNATIVEK